MGCQLAALSSNILLQINDPAFDVNRIEAQFPEYTVLSRNV